MLIHTNLLCSVYCAPQQHDWTVHTNLLCSAVHTPQHDWAVSVAAALVQAAA